MGASRCHPYTPTTPMWEAVAAQRLRPGRPLRHASPAPEQARGGLQLPSASHGLSVYGQICSSWPAVSLLPALFSAQVPPSPRTIVVQLAKESNKRPRA